MSNNSISQLSIITLTMENHRHQPNIKDLIKDKIAVIQSYPSLYRFRYQSLNQHATSIKEMRGEKHKVGETTGVRSLIQFRDLKLHNTRTNLKQTKKKAVGTAQDTNET